ncbi:MAG: hypothetical protein ACJAS1_000420 [Oleiphilaceae bacterium]|jgi:hypothetical protein
MALTKEDWKLVVKKKWATSSTFKKLDKAVVNYLKDKSTLPALQSEWINWKIALGKKKPTKTYKTSDRYCSTLDDIEVICHPTAVQPGSTTPPSTAKTPVPLIMGAPHPKYAKEDTDETISVSGHTYRTFRQSKGFSCGPTCCLIVLKNYFSKSAYTEGQIRDYLMQVPVGAYKPYSGTDMVPLTNFLRKEIGASNYYESCDGFDLKTVTTRTNGQLYPAIVRIEWHGRGAHFIVVVETLSNNTFMVLDPLKNHAQELSYNELANYDGGKGAWDGRIVTSW